MLLKLICLGISLYNVQNCQGLVAQRITRLTTDQKIAGSNPAEIGLFFVQITPNSSQLYMYIWKAVISGLRFQEKIKMERPRVGSNHQPFG